MRPKSTKLFVALFASLAVVSLHPLAGAAKAGDDKEVKFTVRIENVSDKDGQTAADGSRWPFALSPGMWVIHGRDVRLFNEGRTALLGLEAQAEDGNPGELVKNLEGHHSEMLHGVFNTPKGAPGPAPILPGQAYEFTLTAGPGMRLSLVTMFGQSNDWFYAPGPDGIDLFKNGKPLSGDLTPMFRLYDAGTEVDEEPGVGANQAPRQTAPNTGAAENGKVHKAKRSAFYARTGELFRVTIAPEMMP